MHIHIYNKHSIDKLQWPDTDAGNYARRHLEPLIKNGVKSYINNVDAEAAVLQTGDFVFPLIITQESKSNSWVCSTYTQYIGYGQEYTSLIGNPLLSKIVKMTLGGIGKFAHQCKLDSVVYVNNWLFAVDLFPGGLTHEHIIAIRQALTKRYPGHAIVFRSLAPLIHQPLMDAFKAADFKMMASRYIHLTDTKDETIFTTRIIKSDLKLLRESAFEFVDVKSLQPHEYDELLKLYNSLYICQHSSRNPQINKLYMQSIIENELLNFKILKLNNQIRGIAGYVERNGVFLCPFFGYEKNDPDHNVIYRLLSTSLLLEARKKGLMFHQSAGASFYKSIRRAKGCMEYNAIYTRHLPCKQKAGWSVLKGFINTLAPPFMKKY